MSWGKIDDGILGHEKFIAFESKQNYADICTVWFHGFVLGLRTEGITDIKRLHRLIPVLGKRRVNAALKVLGDVGLIAMSDTKIAMHNFAKYNGTPEQRATEKLKWAERQRNKRERDKAFQNGLILEVAKKEEPKEEAEKNGTSHSRSDPSSSCPTSTESSTYAECHGVTHNTPDPDPIADDLDLEKSSKNLEPKNEGEVVEMVDPFTTVEQLQAYGKATFGKEENREEIAGRLRSLVSISASELRDATAKVREQAAKGSSINNPMLYILTTCINARKSAAKKPRKTNRRNNGPVMSPEEVRAKADAAYAKQVADRQAEKERLAAERAKIDKEAERVEWEAFKKAGGIK